VSLTKDYYVLHTSPIDRATGWGGEDLVKDRVACFRVGLHLVRRSFHACRSYPVRDRLGVYGSGSCILNWSPSKVRVKKAQEWLASERPPLTDEEALKLLHPPPPPSSADGKGPVAGLFPGGAGTPWGPPPAFMFGGLPEALPGAPGRGIVVW
jgi:hypothetical protein